MDDLVRVNDPDFVAFISDEGGRPSRRELYFLRAACGVVRDYCGWHIAPSVTDTYTKLEIGSAGIIMLPSMHVTDVVSAVIDSPGDTVTLATTDYDWFQPGFIEAKSPTWRYGHIIHGLASVTMTHGYDTCPIGVKTVIFELMQSADQMSTGNVKEVASPGYRIQWGALAGLSMTPDQINRLSSYKIGGFK